MLAKVVTGQEEGHALPHLTEAGLFREVGFPSIVCGPGLLEQGSQNRRVR